VKGARECQRILIRAKQPASLGLLDGLLAAALERIEFIVGPSGREVGLTFAAEGPGPPDRLEERIVSRCRQVGLDVSAASTRGFGGEGEAEDELLEIRAW
jgi:hypothetical protein